MNGIPDVENEIFSTCTDYLLEFDPAVMTISSQEHIPESLPCVSIYEISNLPHQRSWDSCNSENYSVLEYQVDIYTNDVNGKKKRAEGLRDVVAAYFKSIGFDRISCGPIPNYTNPAVYRITMRFSAIINKDKKTYNRR